MYLYGIMIVALAFICMVIGRVLMALDKHDKIARRPHAPSQTKVYTEPEVKKPAEKIPYLQEVVSRVYQEPVTLAEEPVVVYKNIAANHSNPLHWFECPHPDLPKPSHTEQMILDTLSNYRCRVYREVSFYGLQVKSWSYPRYDILVICPMSPTGIILIEYDGQSYHNTPHTKAMDKLKNKFCKDNSIPLYRYNRKHYSLLDFHIEELMNTYKISKR